VFLLRFQTYRVHKIFNSKTIKITALQNKDLFAVIGMCERKRLSHLFIPLPSCLPARTEPPLLFLLLLLHSSSSGALVAFEAVVQGIFLGVDPARETIVAINPDEAVKACRMKNSAIWWGLIIGNVH
jgi:hypothetical protein